MRKAGAIVAKCEDDIGCLDANGSLSHPTFIEVAVSSAFTMKDGASGAREARSVSHGERTGRALLPRKELRERFRVARERTVAGS